MRDGDGLDKNYEVVIRYFWKDKQSGEIMENSSNSNTPAKSTSFDVLPKGGGERIGLVSSV